MKFYYLLFFLSINLFSQKKDYYDCNSIKNGIEGINVFDTLPNGKLIGRFDRLKNENFKVYKIVTDQNRIFYVTKPIMKKIKKSIRKNKCKGILIEKINYNDDRNRKIIKL